MLIKINVELMRLAALDSREIPAVFRVGHRDLVTELLALVAVLVVIEIVVQRLMDDEEVAAVFEKSPVIFQFAECVFFQFRVVLISRPEFNLRRIGQFPGESHFSGKG